MAKWGNLFDESHGVYPHQKVHIDLLSESEAEHHQAFPVPHAHERTFKKELQDMVGIAILEEYGASKWALPCFVVAKKMAKSDKYLTCDLLTSVSKENNTHCLLLMILCIKSLNTSILQNLVL